MAVTVYSKPGCVQCDATTRTLDARHVKYTVIDLTTDAEAMTFILSLGYRQAPVVVADTGEHWSGFRPDRLASFLTRSE